MKVTTFSYGTLEKGAGAGFPAFVLTLSPEGDTDPLDIVKTITSTATGPVKVIRIYGTGEEREMLTVAKTLADRGYILQAVSDGKTFPGWYHHLHHLIVSIGEPVWMGFTAAELWMTAPATSSPADPTLPGGKIQGTSFYLDASIADPGEVYRYILHSKIPWAVLPRTSSSIHKNLLERDS